MHFDEEVVSIEKSYNFILGKSYIQICNSKFTTVFIQISDYIAISV